MAAAAAMCCSHRAMARGSGLLPLRLRLPGGGGAAQRRKPTRRRRRLQQGERNGRDLAAAAAATHRAGRALRSRVGRREGERAPNAAARCPPPPSRPRALPCPALRPRRGAARAARPPRLLHNPSMRGSAGPRAEAGGGEGEGAARGRRIGAGGGSRCGAVRYGAARRGAPVRSGWRHRDRRTPRLGAERARIRAAACLGPGGAALPPPPVAHGSGCPPSRGQATAGLSAGPAALSAGALRSRRSLWRSRAGPRGRYWAALIAAHPRLTRSPAVTAARTACPASGCVSRVQLRGIVCKRHSAVPRQLRA